MNTMCKQELNKVSYKCTEYMMKQWTREKDLSREGKRWVSKFRSLADIWRHIAEYV
jgi:hypothetical protein